MKCKFTKIMALALAVLSAASMGACSQQSADSTAGGSSAAEAKQLKIGVIQYAVHPSLDNCYKGFLEGLEEAGYQNGKNVTVDFQNAQGEPSNADMIAKSMVAKKEDMIVGIATPAAMSAYGAAKQTEIPVVFTAVSDPVAAGIVQSKEKPGVNCTGSADVLPLKKQLEMIRAFLPNAKKIGVLYTTSEPNSVSTLKTFQELAPQYNFEVTAVGVTNASEVSAAAASVVAKGADCINNFTDNNVVDNLSTVLQAANKAKIPVFGSEEEQVKNGCAASVSIDYVALGKETGKMAAKILKGEAKAADTPVYTVSDGVSVYNSGVLKNLGLSVPSAYSDARDVAAAN